MIQFGIIEVLYFLGETTGNYRMSSITVSVNKFIPRVLHVFF